MMGSDNESILCMHMKTSFVSHCAAAAQGGEALSENPHPSKSEKDGPPTNSRWWTTLTLKPFYFFALRFFVFFFGLPDFFRFGSQPALLGGVRLRHADF